MIDQITDTHESRQLSREIHRPGCRESFQMFLSRNGDAPGNMFNRLDEHLRDHDGKVVRMDSIGLFNTLGTASLQQRDCSDCGNCPLNTVDGDGTRNCPVTGVYVQTVADTPVEPIWLDGRIVGTTYEDDHARYCQLNGILPDACSPRGKQTRQVLERMESALRHVGMDFSHVIRTWFFNEDILDWYDEFNQVRDGFFTERGVFDGLVPASTGVGVTNLKGGTIVGSLTAVLPKNRTARIQALPSPLQGAALEYGSSFSRAVELSTPDHRRLLISGTASIAPGGETLHVGDTEGQVALTMKVVKAILQSREMNWSDVTRGTAYFKHLDDFPIYDRYCREHGLTQLPVPAAQNDICRDDLLFEIEVDAVKQN
jgi:enamine deaminase RidA (YjgF/YER057c/UK114 family)